MIIRDGTPILKQVGLVDKPRPGELSSEFYPELPTEGEFWISREDEPVVVSSPWMSTYAAQTTENIDDGARHILAWRNARKLVMP